MRTHLGKNGGFSSAPPERSQGGKDLRAGSLGPASTQHDARLWQHGELAQQRTFLLNLAKEYSPSSAGRMLPCWSL